MLKNKKSKVKRMRGSNSHGWGHKKKHRGAGHRGGRGLSGTGARGDTQKPGILAGSKKIFQKIAAAKGIKLSKLKIDKNYFGKRGFKSIHKKSQKVLSISYIENNFDLLVEKGLIVKEGKDFVFDTTILGYDKILGKGNFSKKLKIIVNEISECAKEKIESAGGVVEIVSKSSSEN